MTTGTTSRRHEALPGGTRVLNIQDGEPGTILNAFAGDPAGGWVEYEVETQYGIERWKRSDFILFSEFEHEE